MTCRRNWPRIIGSLVLLLLLCGAYGYHSWMRLLEREHIHRLEWRGLSPRLDGIHLAQLSLSRQDAAGSLHLDAESLRLGWRGFSFTAPFWQHIRLARLTLDWQPAPVHAETSPDTTSWQLPALAAVLRLLPESLHIHQLSAALPCPRGRCTLRGNLLGSHAPLSSTAQVQLRLFDEADHLSCSVHLQGEPQALELRLALAVNDRPQLQLDSHLYSTPTETQWRGELSAPNLTEAPAMQRWLGQWLATPALHLAEAPSGAQLAADWQLLLEAGPLGPGQLGRASGQFAASANLPQPWPIPGLGQLQGQLSVSARATEGQWLAERLEADLHLQQLSGDWHKRLPRPLQADSLRLRLRPGSPPQALSAVQDGRFVPLTMDLSSTGATPLELHAELALANQPPWGLQLSEGRLTTATPHLALDDWQARQLQTTLRLGGYLDGEQLQIELGKGSRLQFGELRQGALRLQGLAGDLQGLQLHARHRAGSLDSWRLTGPLALSLQRLEQAALRPQGWHWQGKVAADPQRLELDGQLSADAGLHLAVQTRHDPARGLQLQAQLAELFLRAGNPLAKVLADWPALLELSDGRLNAKADLRLAPGQDSPEARLELSGKGLAGIYDRIALSGLDGRANLELNRRQWQLDLPQLRLAQANPGLPLGPLQLRGRYSASLARPEQGNLQLQQAETAVMGGMLRLAPGQWALGQGSLLFPLQLQGLQLDQLFALYPAQGLAGSGILDGRLPLRIGAAGIRIEQGRVAARAPGGRLQFHSERIRALGRSNPAMQLVTQSLEDFHFGTLDSSVDYDPQGKLRLAMRLEGRNPAIEQGRPIHFNINLEEDIPTLLASLQLTDKVSEIIQQRVQQRMLERKAAAPPEP